MNIKVAAFTVSEKSINTHDRFFVMFTSLFGNLPNK